MDQRTRRCIRPYISEMTLIQYVSRKEGGRGLSIEDDVDASIQRFEDYTEKRRGRLITATGNNTDNTRIIRTKLTKKQKWEEKQVYGHFKRQTSDISHEKTRTRLKKGNLKRETESLFITAQSNAIRSNYIKARIDNTQQNSKCRFCRDRDETTSHIWSKCRKLAHKEYKSRYGWVGKVIHKELYKKFKFENTNKWYMHKPESVLENDTCKLLWDFEIQKYHLISARRPDLVIINSSNNKENLRTLLFQLPLSKIERKQKEK